MSEQDSPQQIREHYARQLPIADHWSDPTYLYSWRHPIGRYQRERVRRALVSLLNKHGVSLSGENLLDIGCGTGDWLRFFAELRGESRGLFGVDLSPENLLRGQLIHSSISIALADARRLPFGAARFGVVSQFVTFEHLMLPDDLSAACAEVARVCAPGGWLLWFDILPLRSTYQRGFTLAEICALFPAFRLVDSQGVFRNVRLPGCRLSTAYSLAARSHLLADLVERLFPGPANNLMVLLQKRA